MNFVGKFPLAARPISIPFTTNDKNKIIYVTGYDNRNEDLCGIFELDLKSNKHKTFKLWKQKKSRSIFNNPVNYYPHDNCCVYSRTQDKILFVGGWNVKDMAFNYKSIVIFNVADKSMKKIKIGKEFGSFPQLALTNNDTHLHIIGGSLNNNHLIYDLTKHKWASINLFSDLQINPNIQTAGLLYNKSKNTLMLFGGYSFTKKVVFNDFWMLDLQNVENYHWNNEKKLKLPMKMSLFGYILYDDRVIITFGGRTEGRKDINNIYYLNLSTGLWIESKVKCAHAGSCHALLIDTIVHIIPRSSYSDHYCIDISNILSEKIMQNIDSDSKENECEKAQLQKQLNTVLNENKKMKLNEIKLMEKISQLNDEVKECKMELNVLKNKYNELKKNRKLDVRNYKKFTSEDVVDWIMSLENNRFGKYNEKIMEIINEQNIDGACFDDIEKSDLTEWGVKDFKDKSALFKHIKILIMQNKKKEIIVAAEGTDDTQYIY